MSSEVCPYCGKTYKRLKSHLPHCKAAASSKTPPTKHDVTVNQPTTSSQLAASLSQPIAKGNSPPSKKSKKVSAVSSAPPQSPSPATAFKSGNSSSSSLSLKSASLQASTKKKKPKLSEQIKTANMPTSTAISLITSPSPSPSLTSTVSNPKKKSLRALIEAEKSKQVSEGPLEGSRSASEDLHQDPTPFVVDPLSSRTTAQTETKTKVLVKESSEPALLSTDTKPKEKKMKASKAARPFSTTKDTSSSPDSKINDSSARPSVRDSFWEDNEGEVEDISVNNKMYLKSTNGHQTRITLHGVKAMLGRANAAHQSSRPSILSQIKTTDDLSSKLGPGTSLSPVPPPTEDADRSLVRSKTLSDPLPSTSLQHTDLQSVKTKSSKSKQASLIPLRHDGSPQPELTSPAAIISCQLSSQVSQATPPPRTVSMNEGLKVDQHMTGLLTKSPPLSQLSSPHLFPLARQTLPARVETLRADDGLTVEKSQLEVRKLITADTGSKGALTQQRLGQVRLRELPEWLVCRTPSRPRDVVEMAQRGWQWYYKKYIDVKKGGVGGVGMWLAGYCVLSYIWSYPQLKRDRWRKYH